MQLLLLRYTQALITQMAQTAVCNRRHSVDQQLCRWLLLSLDRLPGNRLTMTQELIANMLGVRRESVTEAAGKLQKLGVIKYQRGQITVIRSATTGLLCCECYAMVRKESNRAAHRIPPGGAAVGHRPSLPRCRDCGSLTAKMISPTHSPPQPAKSRVARSSAHVEDHAIVSPPRF